MLPWVTIFSVSILGRVLQAMKQPSLTVALSRGTRGVGGLCDFQGRGLCKSAMPNLRTPAGTYSSTQSVGKQSFIRPPSNVHSHCGTRNFVSEQCAIFLTSRCPFCLVRSTAADENENKFCFEDHPKYSQTGMKKRCTKIQDKLQFKKSRE